jgi:hypothetical protein
VQDIKIPGKFNSQNTNNILMSSMACNLGLLWNGKFRLTGGKGSQKSIIFSKLRSVLGYLITSFTFPGQEELGLYIFSNCHYTIRAAHGCC